MQRGPDELEALNRRPGLHQPTKQQLRVCAARDLDLEEAVRVVQPRHEARVAQLADPDVLPWHFPAGNGRDGGPRTPARLDEMFATWERQQRERGFTWWPWR